MNLAERVEYLEEENRQLREAAAQRKLLPLEWGLTRTEAAIVSSLHSATQGFRTLDALGVASNIYGHDRNDPEVIRVVMVRLRKKLRAVGIEIVTRWGEGYQMPEASRAIISEALQ